MEREIYLEGEINPFLADRTRYLIDGLNDDDDGFLPITLFINSSGGWMWDLLGLLDAIDLSFAPIYSLVDGRAESAAFMLLQACDRRSSYPDSTFMFHPPRITAEEASRITAFPCERDVVEEDDPTYIRFLADLSLRSGQPIEVLATWGREERQFTTQEALELGFIDEIIDRPVQNGGS